MKNYKLSVLLMAMAVAITSCSDDFLQKDSPNEVSQATYWQTENDAIMALAACYDAFQAGNLYNDNVDGWKFGFLMRETSTDNGGHDGWGDWQLGTSIAKGTSTPNDECFSMYWNANYELIKRCNVLISGIDKGPLSEDKIKAFKAEAIAIRALAYCNLISTFRDVPYLTEPLTLENPEVAKTSKNEIADAIIKDLREYLPSMPEKNSAQKGRLSREGGYAIMGRVALFTGKWDVACEAYKNVVGKYKLFTAGDGNDYYANYHELFTEANENCEEVLLGAHYNGPGLKEGQTFGVSWGAPMNAINASMNLADEYYCTDGLPIDKSPLFKGKGKLLDGINSGVNAYGAASTDFDLGYYENRDPRLAATLYTPDQIWNGKPFEQLGLINGSISSGVWIRKWYVPENEANEYDGSLDYYIIRYAEVLLSYAEALCETGASQAEITPYINEVRARVGMPTVESVEGTGLNQDQLRKIIRHERRVELAYEDLRMADLYRWGEWENSIKVMQTETALYPDYWGTYPRGYRDARDYVWPIPQSEIDTNTLLEQHKEWQ